MVNQVEMVEVVECFLNSAYIQRKKIIDIVATYSLFFFFLLLLT